MMDKERLLDSVIGVNDGRTLSLFKRLTATENPIVKEEVSQILQESYAKDISLVFKVMKDLDPADLRSNKYHLFMDDCSATLIGGTILFGVYSIRPDVVGTAPYSTEDVGWLIKADQETFFTKLRNKNFLSINGSVIEANLCGTREARKRSKLFHKAAYVRWIDDDNELAIKDEHLHRLIVYKGYLVYRNKDTDALTVLGEVDERTYKAADPESPDIFEISAEKLRLLLQMKKAGVEAMLTQVSNTRRLIFINRGQPFYVYPIVKLSKLTSNKKKGLSNKAIIPKDSFLGLTLKVDGNKKVLMRKSGLDELIQERRIIDTF